MSASFRRRVRVGALERGEEEEEGSPSFSSSPHGTKLHPVFYIPASLFPIASAAVVASSFFFAFVLALILHYESVVSNEWFGPQYEFFPSVSATIGDFTPERNVFIGGMLCAVLFRLVSTMLVGLSALREFKQQSATSPTSQGNSGAESQAVASVASQQSDPSFKLLIFISIFLGFLRLFGACGWISIPSNHDLGLHVLSMTLYYVAASLYQITQIAIWVKLGKTRSAAWKAATLILTLASLCFAGYFLYRHKKLREPGAYSYCAIFEWLVVVGDVGYELTGVMDVSGYGMEIRHLDNSNLISVVSKEVDGSAIVEEVRERREKRKTTSAKPTPEEEFDYFLLLGCDTLTCFLYWTLIHRLASSIWFFSLVAMNFSGLEVALFSLCAVAVLGVRSVLKIAITMPHLLLFVGSFGVFSASITPASTRLVVVALCFMMTMMLIFASFFSPSKQRRDRMVFAFSTGLILHNSLLLGWVSENPVSVRFGNAFVLWCFMMVAVRIMAHRMPKQERKLMPPRPTATTTSQGYLLPSISLGAAYFVQHWLVSSYGVVPRWVDIKPFPSGILVILALIAGVLLSRSQFTTQVPWLGVGIVGALLLLFGETWIGMLGGLILAVVLISTFPFYLDSIKQLPPGRVGGAFGFTVMVLFLSSVYLTAYKFLPLGFLLRERTDLLLLSCLGVMMYMMFTRSQHPSTISTQEEEGEEEKILPVSSSSSSSSPPLQLRLGRMSIEIRKPRWEVGFLLVLITVVVLAPSFVTRGMNNYVTYGRPTSSITTAIWNIHFGYDNRGDSSLEKIVTSIKESGVKIVGLLETDSVHPYVGNLDVVEWLAQALHMESDFGPSVREHTFGCALLSSYPILQTKRLSLPSPQGEIACAIDADINVHGKIIKVLVGHFGNTEDGLDRELQTQAFVDIVQASPYPTIMLSYITTRPYSENYHKLIDAGFVDTAPDYMNRLCQYIMYTPRPVNQQQQQTKAEPQLEKKKNSKSRGDEGILLTGFTRASKGIISDTEFEIARFLINDELIRDYTSSELHPLQVMVDYPIPKRFTWHKVQYDVIEEYLDIVRMKKKGQFLTNEDKRILKRWESKAPLELPDDD